MKVHLNLAITPNPRERYAPAWIIPTVAVSLIVLVWLAGAAIRDFRQSHQFRQSLAQAETKDAAMQAKELKLRQKLGRPELQQMVHETQFVNELISQKQFSLTGLTLKVSKLLPAAARLDGLGISGPGLTPMVQFSVMGKSEDAIESFLDNLENSKDFSDVVVKSQGFRGKNGQGSEQIAVVCTARYVTGFSPAEK